MKDYLTLDEKELKTIGDLLPVGALKRKWERAIDEAMRYNSELTLTGSDEDDEDDSDLDEDEDEDLDDEEEDDYDGIENESDYEDE